MSITQGQTIAGFVVGRGKLWNDGSDDQALKLERQDGDAAIQVEIWQDLPGKAVLIYACRRQPDRYGIDPDIPTMDLLSEQQLEALIVAFQQLPGYYPESLFCIYDVEHIFYRHAEVTTFLSDRKPTGAQTKSFTYTLVGDSSVSYVVDTTKHDWRLHRSEVEEILAAITPENARLPGIRILAHVPGTSWGPYNFQVDLFPAADYWVKDPECGALPQWYTGSLIYINRLAGETTTQLKKRVVDIEARAKRHFDANPGMSEKQLRWLLQRLSVRK